MVVVVLGVPLFQFLLVRAWVQPFQRLHIPTEEGTWVPNPVPKRLMGALYSTFKPWAYKGALANTLIKLLLTAVVGLVFNKSQGNGMLLSAFFCFGWSFGLAVHRPFVYHRVRFTNDTPPSPITLVLRTFPTMSPYPKLLRPTRAFYPTQVGLNLVR